ncbi:MAG TPA: hypothetical protein VGE76_10700, partial [Opitutaceae bacterium]
MRLSQSDLERINVAIATLYEVASVEELLARILSTTARLVENCWVSFNESNILKGGNHSATLCSSSAP